MLFEDNRRILSRAAASPPKHVSAAMPGRNVLLFVFVSVSVLMYLCYVSCALFLCYAVFQF